MRNLTLGDLELGLRDLFDKRKAHLDLSLCGKVYAPQLAAKRTEIDALPSVLQGSRAYANELTDADGSFDGFGHGIWHYTEALLVAPDVSDKVRTAALNVRAAFIPERAILNASYAEEATAAKRSRPRVAELEADLKFLTLPEGKSLYDWVTGFLGAGDSIDTLLSARATAEAGDTAAPRILRSGTIALLGRFRDALADEVKGNDALPRDLDAKLFGYFDELSARRRRAKKDEPNEGPPPGGTPQGT